MAKDEPEDSDDGQGTSDQDDAEDNGLHSQDEILGWINEAETYGIKLSRKSPKQRTRTATKVDKDCFWKLRTTLGWPIYKIATVTGWSEDSIRKHLTRMRADEGAQEEMQKLASKTGGQQQQVMPPVPQQPQAQVPSTPQPPPVDDEDEGGEVEMPEPKYMPIEQREPFLERLKELARILDQEATIPKDKMKFILETIVDVPSIIETPAELHRYLWHSQRIDHDVASIVVQRLFGVISQKRHYDEWQQYQQYGQYGYYGGPQNTQGNWGWGQQPNQYGPGYYGAPPWQQQQPRGITEEEAKRREQEAAQRAKDLAEKDKKIEQLQASVQQLSEEVKYFRDKGGAVGNVVTETIQEVDENGNIVNVRTIQRPYEAPGDQLMRQLAQKTLNGDMPRASKEDSEKMQEMVRQKTEADMKLKMAEMKGDLEKEQLTLKHTLTSTQEMLKKLENRPPSSGEVDPELEVIKEEMHGQTQVLIKLIERGDKRMEELINFGKFVIDPQMAATAELGKASAGAQQFQATPDEQKVMNEWIGGGH